MIAFTEQVQVRKVEGKGNCLYVVCPSGFGDLVFAENPLFFASCQSELFSNMQRVCSEIQNLEYDCHWYHAALVALMSKDHLRIDTCLRKWFPSDNRLKEASVILDKILPYIRDERDQENTPVLSPQLLRDAVLIWRYNSFAHYSHEHSLVMYNMTSFMSHSCKPSAAWAFGEGDTFNLRSVRDLKADDELTISYISEDQLTMPTFMRRRFLSNWLFTCACERCALASDRNRTFKCTNCSIGELVVSSSACSTTPGDIPQCTACCYCTSPEAFLNLLDLEQQYFDRVGSIDPTNLRDIMDVYDGALNMFTVNHWLVYKLETLLLPLLGKDGDPLTLSLQQNRIRYLESLGFPTYTLGWAYEEVGDMLLSKNSKLASSHYERAYWTLRTITGPESGYSIAIQSKWANLNNI